MRMPQLKTSAVVRTALYVAAAVSIAFAAMHLRQHDTPTDTRERQSQADAASLNPELIHCQAIGMAAENDPACKSAWSENRRRFFTYRPSVYSPINRLTEQQPTANSERQ